MLRFAASPTGDMHIGDLRVALFNYIVSQQKKEDLIIRVEDIDKKRNIEGKDTEILDILGLFGIEYTQIIYQSESIRFHSAMALQLMHEKKAFSCFCSDEWLEKKQEEAKEKNEAYQYDDACANLPAELVIDNLNPFTIRINKPQEDVKVIDQIKGEMIFKSKDLDSLIIMNHEKTPTHNFASAVDDMLNDISIVICDESHLDDAPKQDHIRTALKYDKKVQYAHIPSVLGDKLPSIKSLLEKGFLPEAILNYLISIGNKTPKEIFTLTEAIGWFSIENISSSPVEFDIDTLKNINRKHLKALDAKELSRYVGFADEEIGQLAKMFLEEVSTTKELKSKIGAIFSPKKIPDELSDASAILINTIKSAPYFDEYGDFEKHIVEKSGLNNENFSKSLQYVLTGSQNSTDVSKLYKYIKNYIGEIVK